MFKDLRYSTPALTAVIHDGLGKHSTNKQVILVKLDKKKNQALISSPCSLPDMHGLETLPRRSCPGKVTDACLCVCSFLLLLFRLFFLTSIQFHQLYPFQEVPHWAFTSTAATNEQIRPVSCSKRCRTVLIRRRRMWKKLCIDLSLDLDVTITSDSLHSQVESNLPYPPHHPKTFVFQQWTCWSEAELIL